MSVNRADVGRDQPRILLVAVLGALALIALWFIVRRVLIYIEYTPAAYTDYFWGRRWALIPHVLGGLLALTTGVVQLWLGLTNRAGVAHRSLGRVYGAGVLLGSAGGYALAVTIPPQDAAYAAGLFMLCTAWLITTGMALLSVRRRSLLQHREWMIRSYTVTFAFVTYRLVEKLLNEIHVASEAQVATIMAWACWAVPLLLVEPLIQLRKAARRA